MNIKYMSIWLHLLLTCPNEIHYKAMQIAFWALVYKLNIAYWPKLHAYPKWE